MPQACKLSFSSHRLLPMGSYARIADRKGVYELFGPVNKLYCARYDRAMVAFLACLKVTMPWSALVGHGSWSSWRMVIDVVKQSGRIPCRTTLQNWVCRLRQMLWPW